MESEYNSFFTFAQYTCTGQVRSGQSRKEKQEIAEKIAEMFDFNIIARIIKTLSTRY